MSGKRVAAVVAAGVVIAGGILAVAALRSSPPGCPGFADQVRVWREGRTAGPDATERMESARQIARRLRDARRAAGGGRAARAGTTGADQP